MILSRQVIGLSGGGGTEYTCEKFRKSINNSQSYWHE